MKWARDGFLSEDFDIVVLIPLRSVQQRSIEEMMMKYIGEETYKQVKKTAGSRCLVILEGWDEMAAECREKDPFLVDVVKECTLLEEATIIITSRPHACEKLNVGRRVEVVGFGAAEIQQFVKKSFPYNVNYVEKFLQQLKEFPHLESLSYVPMNLVMIVDIFKCNEKKLPSTVTELYRLFIVMTLQRQVRKDNMKKSMGFNSVEEKLLKVLAGVPRVAVRTLLALCRLAYRSFFDWCFDREEYFAGKMQWKDPKITFTIEDLKECGIEETAEWDGYGLLNATHTHQLPTDTITYNFSHLTIQEFLCAVQISMLTQEGLKRLLSDEHFRGYLNVFIFLSGLTGLESSEMCQFVFSKLKRANTNDSHCSSSCNSLEENDDIIKSIRCLYESQMNCPSQSAMPIVLNMIGHSIQPHDCLCISYVMSRYPVSSLVLVGCCISDKGAELLVKHKSTTGQLLEKLYLNYNDLTIDGLVHIAKIVNTSKLHALLLLIH